MEVAEIKLDNISKEYNYKKVFSDLSYTFHSGRAYAIRGANGSGKSSLLQCIVGFRKANAGSIEWNDLSGAQITDPLIDYFSFSAPYQELIEEYTLSEHLDIVSKRWKENVHTETIRELMAAFRMEELQSQPIKKMSSGQKQKTNLIHAFCQQKEVLILDEPTSFLDSESIEVYQRYLGTLNHSIVIVASNEEKDYLPGSETLNL